MWKFFRNLHLITSVVFGLFATAAGLSGSALVFREEMEHAIYEPRVSVDATLLPLTTLLATASAVDSGPTAFMWWNRTGGFRRDHAKVMTDASAGQGPPGPKRRRDS